MSISDIELFVLKCASIRNAVSDATPSLNEKTPYEPLDINEGIFGQFDAQLRRNAMFMADYYQIFYMLENDIRKLIDETLAAKSGRPDWWDELAPGSAKDEYNQNLTRERESGFTARSDNPLDYITFGQLQEVIRHNWDVFGGILSNQKALGRVMYALNNLRGPIAHCGLLAEDEVDRLRLTVKDWFRLLEGPK